VKRFVLDASVALAWFLDDPVSAYAIELKHALRHGRALIPPLWTLEVANALAVAERRGNLTADQVVRCLSIVEQLLIESVDTSAQVIPLRQVLTTARSFRLTAYDAIYLETARSEGIPLATLDKALRAAAPRAGVDLYS